MAFKLNILGSDVVVSTNTGPSHLTKQYLDDKGVGIIFVETGTYLGDTVKLALEAGYKKVHSVELDPQLFADAVKMFADDSRVQIWFGDSVDCLKEIMNLIGDQPATFWLDAHASGPLPGGKSGGSPVVDELNIITSSPHNGHTIFIDDRRLFGSAEWSHVTEDQAMSVINQINPNYEIQYFDGHIAGDVICASVPK